MKLLLSILVLFTSFNFLAQAPEEMTFQAVIRDANGDLLSNSNVGVRVSVLQGSISGAAVYSEDHTVLTNDNGLLTLVIGQGTPSNGSIASIDWSQGPFYLQTEVDIAGGTNYSLMSTTQFLSVPYALFANKAAKADTALYAVNTISGSPTAYLFLRKKQTVQYVSSGNNSIIGNYDGVNNLGFTFNNSTGVITFQTKGYYSISATMSVLSNSPGRKIMWFECSSPHHANRLGSQEMDGYANRISTAVVGMFNAGDQIQLRFYQNTGSTVPVPNTSIPDDELEVSIIKLF